MAINILKDNQSYNQIQLKKNEAHFCKYLYDKHLLDTYYTKESVEVLYGFKYTSCLCFLRQKKIIEINMYWMKYMVSPNTGK